MATWGVKRPVSYLGSREGVTDEGEALRVRLLLLIELAGGTYEQLARKTGVKRSHIGAMFTKIKNGRQSSVSPDVARRLADGMGCTTDWVLYGRGPGPKSDELPARYPNMEQAIEEMRSKWSDATVAELRTWGLRSPTDFPVDTWIMLGQQIERARREGREIGQALVHDDDTPPVGRG